jgi:DNA-binding CsgD family transcriptional regulator
MGGGDVKNGLTPREIELLDLIARGYTNKKIASELHLSPDTVKNYNSDIFAKLGVTNREQAAVYAAKPKIRYLYREIIEREKLLSKIDPAGFLHLTNEQLERVVAILDERATCEIKGGKKAAP